MPAPGFVIGRRLKFDYASVVPIFLECQRCTACCRWPGQVRLSDAEIGRLAEFKGQSAHDFIQQFTRLSQDRQRLVLQEKSNGECGFLDGDDCTVQPVKPQQCRDFPNLWNFPGFEKNCCALPRLVSEAEYRRLVPGSAGILAGEFLPSAYNAPARMPALPGTVKISPTGALNNRGSFGIDAYDTPD